MSSSKQNLSILYTSVFLLSMNGLFSKLIPLDAVTTTQLRSVIAALALFTFALFKGRNIKIGCSSFVSTLLNPYSIVCLVKSLLRLLFMELPVTIKITT